MNRVSASMKKKNVSGNSSVQHGIWAKSGGEWPCFPYTGKPGINVDLEDLSNPLEYFKMFCTPEIAEIIARERNWYAQKLLESCLISN
jgi:hypothetical protein